MNKNVKYKDKQMNKNMKQKGKQKNKIKQKFSYIFYYENTSFITNRFRIGNSPYYIEIRIKIEKWP